MCLEDVENEQMLMLQSSETSNQRLQKRQLRRRQNFDRRLMAVRRHRLLVEKTACYQTLIFSLLHCWRLPVFQADAFCLLFYIDRVHTHTSIFFAKRADDVRVVPPQTCL